MCGVAEAQFRDEKVRMKLGFVEGYITLGDKCFSRDGKPVVVWEEIDDDWFPHEFKPVSRDEMLNLMSAGDYREIAKLVLDLVKNSGGA